MAEKMKKIDMHDFPVLDCAQEQNGNPYFLPSFACKWASLSRKIVEIWQRNARLSSIFFEAAICENCCFMRVDQGVKLRSQSAEEAECLHESEPFATYVNF